MLLTYASYGHIIDFKGVGSFQKRRKKKRQRKNFTQHDGGKISLHQVGKKGRKKEKSFLPLFFSKRRGKNLSHKGEGFFLGGGNKRK